MQTGHGNEKVTEGFTLYIQLLSPSSKGNMTLASTNPFDHPVIDPQYLTDEQDIADLIYGNISISFFCFLFHASV